MPLQLSQLLKLEDKSLGKEFELQGLEKEHLMVLGERLRKHLDMLKPFLSQSTSNMKILLFDVETDVKNRDQIALVGVLTYPGLKIFHYDGKLSKIELDTLVGDAQVVVFAAFNFGFDLPRVFSEDAKRRLLRRVTWFGGRQVSYYIYRRQGVVSYALDVMRVAGNLINEKSLSLKAQSKSNQYFKKRETKDYADPYYNAWDLLSEFELLVRCAEKAAEFLNTLDFRPSDVIDFILRMYRYETIESHMAPLKLFESGGRIAKILVAPYSRFPSFPAFYAGGRIRCNQPGRFEEFAFYDIRSEYPSVMSRCSPKDMRLIFGEEAKGLAEEELALIKKWGSVEAFRRLYVDQEQPALLLSSWILVRFTEDATWMVEVLKEKSKKSNKLMRYTLLYRNRRAEQARTEGYVKFHVGKVYNFPLYFLFLQSKTQLKRIRILDACGFVVYRDDAWREKWEKLYQMRKENPVLSTSFKITLNATAGLLCDVDQIFSNLALGSHIPTFARVVSHLVGRELGDDLLYTDTDSFIVKAEAEQRLAKILNKLTPWGAKKEYPGSREIVIFRTKRYAVKLADGTWEIKGAERGGFGREKNRIESFLLRKERQPADDIRQVTKQLRTPNIPAVRKLLKGSETGEWCYYFSYPLARRLRVREEKWFFALSEFMREMEAGGSGESLRVNNYIRRIAEWVGFVKRPSKKLSRSRWFLELFEYLRAYGFGTKREICDLVHRKTGIDLEAIEAHMSVESYDERQQEILLDQARETVVYEFTRNQRRIYLACKLKEPLIHLAEKLISLPSAKLRFQASTMDDDISAQVFAPLLGKPDTTFLEAQISQASLLHLPIPTYEKMRLLAKTIGALGNSDNRGVKLAVETLRVHQDELIRSEPWLRRLPRRARKRIPFSQRRFYVIQRFPYKVRYHLGWDAVKGTQFKKRKFIFREDACWLPSAVAEIVITFFEDTQLLECALNQALKKTIRDSDSMLFRLFTGDLELRVVPYARYKRFDVAYDIPHGIIRDLIEEFEDICEREGYDYRKGLGFIGLNGRVLTDSRYVVPGNVVLYDRNRRFNLRWNSFLKKYKPFVKGWKNDQLGRLEIQTFACRNNNHKANPFASLLNVLERFRLQAPGIFRFVERCLSVITYMLHDPPGGSGVGGAKSSNSTQEQLKSIDFAVFMRYSYLAGLGLGPPWDV